MKHKILLIVGKGAPVWLYPGPLHVMILCSVQARVYVQYKAREKKLVHYIPQKRVLSDPSHCLQQTQAQEHKY